MSWTWCIGMFLPVLLVRDFGPWAWAVFAIPNVIGAAAMGRVLRDAEASREITDAHTEACTAFSAVTILFQVTFVGWIGRLLVGNWAAVLMLGTVALTLAISQRGRRAEWAMAAGLFVFSVVAFAVALSSGREMILAGFPTRWDEESTALPYLAMVCMLGFGLCPYLDLTFHKARQATSPAAGLGAFIFGFGGPFLLMLVFTLWYARLLAPLSRRRMPAIPNGLRWALAAHLCVQCGYTIAVHWRELGWGPRLSESIAKNPRKVAAAVVGFVAAIAVHGVGLMSAPRRDAPPPGRSRLPAVPVVLWAGVPGVRVDLRGPGAWRYDGGP